MIVLGIDPGTTAVGCAAVSEERGVLALRGAELLSIPKRGDTPEKLAALARALERALRRYRPELIAVEKLFFGKNAKTALAVAEARGVILLTAENLGLRVYECTPLEVKLAVSGYGRADKKQVRAMVARLLADPNVKEQNLGRRGRAETDRVPDDVTDAMAIAITALRYVNPVTTWPKDRGVQ